MAMPEFSLKIEIEKMDHQEDQDNQRCMDHESGEERCLGRIGYLISDGPCNPVQKLENESIDNMKQEPAEQDNFKDLNKYVCCHKVGSNVKYSWVIEYYESDVYAEMNQQEYGQEQAKQGHQQLLADGRIKNVAHMLMIFG